MILLRWKRCKKWMGYEKCIGRCSTKILYVYADNMALASGSVRVESSNSFKEKNEKK